MGRQYAEDIGDIVAEAISLDLEARCTHNHKQAPTLRMEGRELLLVCGLVGGATDLMIRAGLAEVHFIKTEYAELRRLSVEMLSEASPGQPTPILDLELYSGAENLVPVRNNLDIANEQSTALGFPRAVLLCDTVYAALEHAEGNLAMAKVMFQQCIASLQSSEIDGVISCFDRLPDPLCLMDGFEKTSEWATIYLCLALETGDKLSSMKAVRHLASIAVAQEDEETGLTLYEVALDGFTFMDIHRWRAECTDHTGTILGRRGNIAKAAKFLREAKPLFATSLQTKNSAQMETKLLALTQQK
ncbi:hypothetical protein K438DRAFT_1774215 [Mycena galopus ATCC 62051]|nr:hypothetical protein K438DRAFT_1774215 [Mycena galopus ATCC 62051]